MGLLAFIKPIELLLYKGLSTQSLALPFVNVSIFKPAIPVYFMQGRLLIANNNTYQIILLSGIIIGILLLIVSCFTATRLLKNSFQKKSQKTNDLLDELNSLKKRLNEKEEEVSRVKMHYENMTEMLAHDLKNPLNIIFHQLELLQNIKAKTSIENAGKLMMNMLQNVLDIQQNKQTGFSLNKEQANLEAMINEAIYSAEFMSRKKNIKLSYKSDFNYEVLCDTEIMTRTFSNTIINLIKYSPQNEQINVNTAINDSLVRISFQSEMNAKDALNMQNFLVHKSHVLTESRNSIYLRFLFIQLAISSHHMELGFDKLEGNKFVFWFNLPVVEKTENSTEINIDHNTDMLRLTTHELHQMDYYLKNIRQYSIYELSKIKAIIKEIPDLNDNVSEWKEQLSLALSSMNEQRFHNLLDSVTESTNQHEKQNPNYR